MVVVDDSSGSRLGALGIQLVSEGIAVDVLGTGTGVEMGT